MCLGLVADLHLAQLMPLPLSLSLAPVNPDWYVYLPGFTFLAHLGSSGQNPEGHKMVVVVVVVVVLQDSLGKLAPER